MNKIFAYTKDAKLTKKTLDKLAEAGYIPVPVDSLDCIRLIEPVPDAEASLIFQSAIKTLMAEKYGDNKSVFGKFVLQAVLDSQNKDKG